MIYRVWCRFEPVENVLTGRLGRWRAVRCHECYYGNHKTVQIKDGMLLVKSYKGYLKGSFINPKRAMGL